MKSKNFFKRPFLKYAYFDLFYLKLLIQKKKIKFFKFKFFKKRRRFKFKSSPFFKKKLKKNYGAFLQFIYNKTYVNNLYRYLLYNWNINLKSYYKLIVINFKKRNEKAYHASFDCMKKKKFFFFFPFLKWPKKNYLNLLNNFYIIILVLYKKNYLVNDITIIIKLIIQFKYYLLKLINNNKL